MSYSSLTWLVLRDSCAPASDPPPVEDGFIMALQSATLLVSSSWICEFMVALVRFVPVMEWLSGANDGVAKSDGSDVRGTWLQLMCCTLPKRLCP